MVRRGWMRRFCIVLLLSLTASLGVAQSNAQGDEAVPRLTVQSPVLVVDSEAMFNASAYGQRVARDIERVRGALREENDRIADELRAEEQALTDRRTEMTAEDFRVLADAFDEKVQRIRDDREAASVEQAQMLDVERRAFLNAALPVLEAIMREAGAAVVLERRDVFVNVNAVDITELAVARLNAALGDGKTPTDQ